MLDCSHGHAAAKTRLSLGMKKPQPFDRPMAEEVLVRGLKYSAQVAAGQRGHSVEGLGNWQQRFDRF